MLKGLPLAYNKDMQEDKEGMFDTVKTVVGSLEDLYGHDFDTMKVNKEVMEEAVGTDFSNATELADYLAAKGYSVQKAHEIVGKLVLHCIEKGCYLKDVTLATYQQFSELIESDIYDIIAPSSAVKRRNSYGGTGFEQVKIQIEKAKGALVTK